MLLRVLVLQDLLEKAKAPVLHDEDAQLSRWCRPIEVLALLEEIKALAPVEDNKLLLPLKKVVVPVPLEEAEATTLLAEG